MTDRDAEPESLVVPLDTGERMHYLDWGRAPSGDRPGPDADLPPLILLHGLSQTAWSWAPVARRLRSTTRVLTPDMRGHGLSEAPRTGYDLGSLAIDALTVMVANGWGRDVGGPPAVVAGHGFGAMVAATMAVTQPESVAGLALVDGGWEAIADSTRRSPADFLASLAEPPEVMRSMDAWLVDRRDFDPQTWDADQERAARAQVDQKHAGHVTLVSRTAAVRGVVDAMFSYDPATLAQVTSPMVIAIAESGTADDETAHERRLALDDIVRLRADAGLEPPTVVTYPGAGHNLMRYRPAELAAELARLLERARGQSQR